MNITKKQTQQICKKLGKKLVNFSFLGKGDHNLNYLIKTKNKKYVLRIRNVHFKSLKKEYFFLKSTNGKFGPKVYLFDDSKKIIPKVFLVEEFLEGKHPSKKATDKFVIAMAKWFRRLHDIKTLKKPDCARKGYYSLSCAVKPYYNNYVKYKYRADNKLPKELYSYFEKAIELCEINDKAFIGRKRFSILNMDPSRGNVFCKKDKIKLIDWEFYMCGVPEWDIIYFFDSYKLESYHKKLFFKTYNYPSSRIAQKRIQMLSLVQICAEIGYLLLRLDIIYKNKQASKKNKKDILERINKRITPFKKLIEKVKEM